MAQGGVVVDRDQFNCSICLDVLKDPVTIPCGHTYCSDCIHHYWDQDEYMRVFACPQCRQTFSPRPLLGRNTMLADVVEKFKTTGLQTAAVLNFAGPEDVECDVCTIKKHKAVKSCTVCLASYCEVHLQPHYESAAFKKHRLMDASKTLQDTLCPRHDKLLEVFCRTDNQCICLLCLADEHRGHDTVLVETEMQEKRTQLGEMKLSTQQSIQEREIDVRELRQAILSLGCSARAAIEESDKVFTELIRSIELKRFEMRELLRAQEKTAVSQAEELLEKIQRELVELKTRDTELEKLSHTEDQIIFLQSCHAIPLAPVLENLPSVGSDHNLNFGPVITALSDFKSVLLEVCQEGFVSIYKTVRDVVIVNSQNLSSSQKPELLAQVTPVTGLDPAPPNHLNSFTNLGSTALSFGGFTLSTFGSKLSSASRPSRHLQRRSHCRRK